MRVAEYLFEELQERKETMAKEQLMTMVLAFSSGFSGDFSAIESLMDEQIDNPEQQDDHQHLKDFNIKKG